MPAIVIIINNYESFNEMYQMKYDDIILTLTREGNNCGISFVFSTSAYSDMRYRLTQNFKNKIALRMNNESDYNSIFDRAGKKRPSNLFGRGLISENGQIYEFQTAKMCEPEEYNVFVRELIEHQKEINKTNAKPVPVLPDRITLEEVRKNLKSQQNVPLGIYTDNLSWCKYNFEINEVNINVFDTENILIDKNQDIIGELENFVIGLTNGNSSAYNICIIIGLEKFLQILSDEELNFEEILSKAKDKQKYSFVIVENVNKIKNYAYEDWYKNYFDNDKGIWIGNGFDDQYLINLVERKGIKNKIGRSFGYIVRAGEFRQIKLIGMKDKGDDDYE